MSLCRHPALGDSLATRRLCKCPMRANVRSAEDPPTEKLEKRVERKAQSSYPGGIGEFSISALASATTFFGNIRRSFGSNGRSGKNRSTRRNTAKAWSRSLFLLIGVNLEYFRGRRVFHQNRFFSNLKENRENVNTKTPQTNKAGGTPLRGDAPGSCGRRGQACRRLRIFLGGIVKQGEASCYCISWNGLQTRSLPLTMTHIQREKPTSSAFTERFRKVSRPLQAGLTFEAPSQRSESPSRM